MRWLVVGATQPAVLQEHEQVLAPHCETTGYFAARWCFDMPRVAIFLTCIYMRIVQWLVPFMIGRNRHNWV